jgi:hypothetical protein
MADSSFRRDTVFSCSVASAAFIRPSAAFDYTGDETITTPSYFRSSTNVGLPAIRKKAQ